MNYTHPHNIKRHTDEGRYPAKTNLVLRTHNLIWTPTFVGVTEGVK